VPSKSEFGAQLFSACFAPTCPGGQYSYSPAAAGADQCSACAPGASLVSPSAGCAPAAALGGPVDTAFYLSGSQAEGVDAFAFTDGSIGYAPGPFPLTAGGAAGGALALNNSIIVAYGGGAGAPAALPSGGAVAFSAAAWVKCAPPAEPMAVLGWGLAASAGFASPQSVALGVDAATSPPGVTGGNVFAICDSTWHHVAVTYAPRPAPALSAFVDGAAQPLGPVRKGASIVLPDAAASTLSVGWSGLEGAGGMPFVGALADVRIYARTLLPAEVAELALPPFVAILDAARGVVLASVNATNFVFGCGAGVSGAQASLVRSNVDGSWTWSGAAPSCN